MPSFVSFTINKIRWYAVLLEDIALFCYVLKQNVYLQVHLGEVLIENIKPT